MAVIIQSRRDNLSNWINLNPILASGELSYVIDTNQLKIGNGITSWVDLPFITGDSNNTSIDWDDINNKPISFPPDNHNHDDIYYRHLDLFQNDKIFKFSGLTVLDTVKLNKYGHIIDLTTRELKITDLNISDEIIDCGYPESVYCPTNTIDGGSPESIFSLFIDCGIIKNICLIENINCGFPESEYSFLSNIDCGDIDDVYSTDITLDCGVV